MRARAVLLAVAVAMLAAAPARADDGGVAAATELFDEAVALMDKHRYAEACPKLAQSQEIAPSGGTLLALGECYERIGRPASAWLAFREAAARAANAGKKDAEDSALARAARMSAVAPRITVKMSDAAVMQGAEARRDGTPLKAAELGAPTPVDPGTHIVEGVAAGHRTWTARVAVAASGNVEVVVPALELVAPGQEDTAPAQPAAREPRSDGSTQRVIGLGVAAAGLVAAGAGTFFGFAASAKNHDALAHCNTTTTPTRCDAEGLALTDDAKSDALLSTIFIVAGGAALVGGAVLWLTAPVSVAPTATTHGGGLSARARF